ncbi:hypothetical protein BpHYR1_052430 [Brachionus plicatilis]|uniref:Uncharacterized protein n=1 Tax=Brachionus plicatilis TaxID=10195 RepID=A0A3M7R0N4_BRAPC|nr:hypothetical protein BpHYR1_052430 [Brachionus plicatilis]
MPETKNKTIILEGYIEKLSMKKDNNSINLFEFYWKHNKKKCHIKLDDYLASKTTFVQVRKTSKNY